MTAHPLLDRFLPWLREHSADAELVFGPWLPSLAAAVGRMAERRDPDPTGEPTGFSGLARRGPYDRLLTTEWLLADELPDEFLRRAVDREHLFVELEHVLPHRAPWTVVLCDTGPEQLGGPRLVHLALLVVLSMRPNAPGRIAVGSLQGDALIEPATDEGAGRRLFAAGTREPPTAEHARAWLARLQGDGERPELWVVGGSAAQRLGFGRANRVTVTEDWATGELLAEVQRADGARAKARLPAPPHEAGRVLEDPFSARRPDALGGDLEHLSATYAVSRWLFLKVRRNGQDRMVALASPKAPRVGGKETTRHARLRERLLAAGRLRKAAMSLWTNEKDLVLEHERRTVVRMPLPEGFATDPDAPLAPLYGGRRLIVVADTARTMWTLDFNHQTAKDHGRIQGIPWLGPQVVWWRSESGLLACDDGVVRPLEREGVPVSPLVAGMGLVRLDDGRVAAQGMGSTSVVVPVASVGSHRAWFPAASGSAPVLAGILGDELHLAAWTAEGFVHMAAISLGPAPVLWAGPDPQGLCYAVLTHEGVRFFSAFDGALWSSWSRL